MAVSLLSGFSLEAAAIGIGDIRLHSALGAPLQAEIPLHDLGDLDIGQLKVKLGTRDEYNALGVDDTYQNSRLKIEPFVRDGEGYVRITTRQPIVEPYMDFVLSLRWPQGQLVREFTVLLDPPTRSEPAADTGDAPAHKYPAVHHRVPVRPQMRAAAQRQDAAAGSSYMVRRGDSLWRVANRITPARVPVEQTMAAILALNPRAFVHGDPNLLKEAATLTLPNAEQIAAAAGTLPVAPAQAVARSDARVAAPAAAAPAVAVPAPQDAAPAESHLAEENAELKEQVADLTGNVATLNRNLAQSEQRLHQLESQLNQVLEQMQQQRATVAALSGSVASGAKPAQAGSESVINQVSAAELNGPARAHTPWWVHLLYWLGIGGAKSEAKRS